MAYCNQCGAYIPDGHSKCLACGYDAAEAAQEKAAQAYEYKEEKKRIDSDFLKKQLEQQRRRQQENSRKWAETEKAQRDKTRREHENRAYSATRSTDNKKYSTGNTLSGSKLFSLMSYFGFLFVLPYIFCQNDDFALFHAKQGLILFVAGLAAKIAASILGLGWLVSIAKIYFIYKGVTAVLDGRREKLPYIGSLF